MSAQTCLAVNGKRCIPTLKGIFKALNGIFSTYYPYNSVIPAYFTKDLFKFIFKASFKGCCKFLFNY